MKQNYQRTSKKNVTSKNNGITMIALVITITVMLILSVVAMEDCLKMQEMQKRKWQKLMA